MPLAARVLGALEEEAPGLVWVGERVWAYPVAMAQTLGRAGLARSVLVRSQALERGGRGARGGRRGDGERLWAMDVALRSGAVVIGDGSGLDVWATRRLQLAAEASGGVCFLARPAWERGVLSSAATRWAVSWAKGGEEAKTSKTRRWTVENLRCKGVQPAVHATRAWTWECDHEARALRVVADVFDRPGEAALGPARPREPWARRVG